ncbi:DUF2474 domain-containing protein [Hafnia paralvei]|jgi:hypothetical protein|uniref:DUF2474 domain-containing protein n=1 Tax=Hafnia paralvei TaxID=546367 RepID=A0A2A2M9U3_9GAMM|nr:hypothetical protein HMPREF0864_02678 [Enterobacteriaceae bacterium 9_2_54FAA]NIH29490.1 DUF2474 domain-containing protein [Hafnia paralvei]PAV95391.1 DUF2474 domain-containing protein [Hafnia paralvei]PNK66137.1 DUF2474 domain-containing protein [Hafnia paralvei]TBL56827.1 DUF2474 domain-containing protein [Hafnia paralvei]
MAIAQSQEKIMSISEAKTVANPLWKRLLWLVAIWGGSVLALGCVSMLFRLLMTAAGLKSH